jgi:hypothetical protein
MESMNGTREAGRQINRQTRKRKSFTRTRS